jgi:hypothetical protein
MLIGPSLYPVVSAPFTATVEWTSTEVKPDGAEVHYRIVSQVMRDAAGRQRFEDVLDDGKDTVSAPIVRLYDPVGRLHMYTKLDGKTMRAEQSPMGATATGTVTVPASMNAPLPPEPKQTAPEIEGNITREQLGRQKIASVAADGMRVSVRVLAEDGKPERVVVDEIWTSPLWRLPLMHRHEDGLGATEQALVTEFMPGAPDASLFNIPPGFTVINMQKESGRSMVMSRASTLPAQILDDDLAAAVDRVQGATTAHDTVIAPVHVRYALRMIDLEGAEHTGTIETWWNQQGSRYEAHSDDYDEVRVTINSTSKRYEKTVGTRPLRFREFEANELTPVAVIRRLLHTAEVKTIPRLRAERVGDAELTCAGDAGTAVACFDRATGFLMSAAVDREGMVYQGWRKVGDWAYRASTVQVAHDGHLLVEGKITAADTTIPEGTFVPGAGMKEMTLSLGGVYARANKLRNLQLAFTLPVNDGPSGKALVHVWLDDKGKVKKSALEDADDPKVAESALRMVASSSFPPNPADPSTQREGVVSVEVRSILPVPVVEAK